MAGYMARPKKLTADLQAQIATALRAGNTKRAAASYAGVGETTLYVWLDRNAEFRAAVRKAEADAEVRNVTLVQRAAESTWQASAWWLERRHPDTWALRQQVEASVQVDLPALMQRAFAVRRPCELEPPDIEPPDDA
jgi:hypothetical protein